MTLSRYCGIFWILFSDIAVFRTPNLTQFQELSGESLIQTFHRILDWFRNAKPFRKSFYSFYIFKRQNFPNTKIMRHVFDAKTGQLVSAR